MIGTKTSIRPLAILLALAFSFVARAEERSPTAVVDALHAGIVEIMKASEQLDVEARRARFVELLPAYLDQPYMARKSVGRSWKTLTPEQQPQLLERFLQLSVATYADRFQGYSGERFETLEETLGEEGKARVEGQVVASDGKIYTMSYRMHQVDGKWLIYDVFLNGSVSEMAMRRSEFSSVLKREGFDHLIAAIDGKVQSLSAGPSN